VERVIGPDATTLACFALGRITRVVDGLVVDADAMRRHLDSAGDIVASGGLLLALVKKGVMRQEAYGWVQRCALGDDPKAFRARLKADADIGKHLSAADIDSVCSLETQLQHVDAMFARVL
jgi:adenylosuccinate lyase